VVLLRALLTTGLPPLAREASHFDFCESPSNALRLVADLQSQYAQTASGEKVRETAASDKLLNPHMPTTHLARRPPHLPKKVPTLDQVAKLLESDNFLELQAAVYRLKEYRLGLRIVTRLIEFAERHPLLDTTTPKHQRLLVHLWRSKLRFLDLADQWGNYLSTVQELRARPELQDSFGPTALDESAYRNYQRILGQSGVKRGLRFLLEDILTQARSAQEALSDPYGRRLIRIPRQTRHMLESPDLKDRILVVQRKVALRESGRRVDYLRHKQSWELTDEEYAARVEWLKMWREYCERCRSTTASRV
jgi:hypothetical protein